jgi:cytochrome bd-type quinol oxidase subunit 1
LSGFAPKRLIVSRAQFAFTVGFHILWPAYTIGVSGFIVILDILWLRTRRPVYRDLLRFWIHLFALGFAMGVVTGLVMSYQIGTQPAPPFPIMPCGRARGGDQRLLDTRGQ